MTHNWIININSFSPPKDWFSLMIHSILSFGLLFIGGSIYLLFRPKSLLMFVWVDKLGLTAAIDKLRDEVSHISLSRTFTYCLPDGLWVASYVILVHAIIPREHRDNLIFWSYLLPIIAVVFEFFQYLNLIPGVFDIFDLVSYIIPLIIYTIYLRYEKVL
ncbi:MAG: hypothetical protein PHO36_15945 [Parabacteroides sp.]|nr:hypothetical protein [Parabacteroides sp.]